MYHIIGLIFFPRFGRSIVNFVCLWIQFVLKKSKKRSLANSRHSKAHSPVLLEFVWMLESGEKKEEGREKDGKEKKKEKELNRAECELLFLLKGQVSSLLAPFSVYYTCVT